VLSETNFIKAAEEIDSIAVRQLTVVNKHAGNLIASA
jgi:hypothetical protein